VTPEEFMIDDLRFTIWATAILFSIINRKS
jgi:hypothetical protein